MGVVVFMDDKIGFVLVFLVGSLMLSRFIDKEFSARSGGGG